MYKNFFHPGCASKHKVYDRNREYVTCPGPFKKVTIESEKETDLRTPTIGIGRDRLGSTESAGGSGGGATGMSGSAGMDTKIDWLIRNVKEMKDEVACKK